MGLLDDIIRDARRPLPGRHGMTAEPLRVQREAMPEDDVPLSGGDVAAPAAPIEEQEDGSWTLYRFQEAPAGGGATPSVAQAPAKGGSVRQRAAGTPFETDPPPAQDEPVEARPGIRHPTRVRAGGIDEVSVETAVTETRKPGPETDASESFERAPERISESRTLKGSTSASSMMPRLHSSSDEVPASVPNRMSRPISSFAAERVEGQRRPPGPGAPPEPLNGASGLSEAAAVEEPAWANTTPRSVTPRSRGSRNEDPAGQTPARGVHIGLLEVQVINAEEPARPAAPSSRQDVARRRYWKRY